MQDEIVTGFRLSPQQVHAQALQRDGSTCPVQCIVSLEGDLRVRDLEDALRVVVGRHEILRTTFRRPAGMRAPLQVIQDAPATSWRAVDLVADDRAGGEAGVEVLIRQERRPFDLEAGPIVRACLVTLAPGRHILVLTVPSLCADAGPLEGMVREPAHFYGGSPDGEATPHEPLQYADFSEWQNGLFEADDED